MMIASFNHITLVLCLCGLQFGVAYSNPATLPAVLKSYVLQAPATGCMEIVHDDYRVYVCDGKTGSNCSLSLDCKDTVDQPPAEAVNSCESTTRSFRSWEHIAHIDMNIPEATCPSGYTEINISSNSSHIRACRRASPATNCISNYFPVQQPYTQVVGRIIGYQYGAPFAYYYGSRGIDGNYVDGYSITHGESPREHIWTFAAGSDDVGVGNSWVCPCSASSSSVSPSFVGQDYFCETANHETTYTYDTPFYSHPLWDGQRCGGKNDCCNFHNPPWFCKSLPQPTVDPVELRQCNGWRASTDTPFQILDIYVR